MISRADTETSPARRGGAVRTGAPGIASRYEAVRRATEDLSRPLGPEDCLVQSMPDASPVKWHIAHTTWFFETFILLPHAPGYSAFHPSFSYLFNSYYNAVGDRVPRGRRGLMTRPTLGEVSAYRAAVDGAMAAYLGSIGDDPDSPTIPVVELGLNHEQQHQELILTDIKHAFAQNPLRPAYRDDLPDGRGAAAAGFAWVDRPGGLGRVGHDGVGFAFDNEGPRHRVYVEDYRLGSRPVTCGEYLEFIDGGGYSRPEPWLSDGWAAVQAHRWEAPMYWERGDGGWMVMTLGGLRPVVESEPVCHVSFYEADAFARWSGARLPTEFEWELAAAGHEVAGNFVEGGPLHPRAHGGPGLAQLFGDVWEWTRSPYTPYPGSRPAAGALGEYNAKFMCNQIVLRGGSCVTPASHVRATYRNFFPPDARWQFSGIRLAKDS